MPEYIKKLIKSSDEEILELIKNEDLEALDFLFNKYKPLVKIKARPYFLIGADNEDIIQEGMIGLYKAIRDYKKDKDTSFKVFAEMCITRQILTAIKAATRKKHKPLNNYMSLNKSAFDYDSGLTFIDMFSPKKITNPEDIFIGNEEKVNIETYINQILSSLESTILDLYLQGKSYAEISTITKKPIKSIDNALQRVKKKVQKILSEKKY